MYMNLTIYPRIKHANIIPFVLMSLVAVFCIIIVFRFAAKNRSVRASYFFSADRVKQFDLLKNLSVSDKKMGAVFCLLEWLRYKQ